MFELHQLRCFVAVASEMNFHRAAERLNMTQPPVSRQVQVLERQLGVQLFDRSGRTIRLTAAGKRFVNEARDLLRRAEDAKVIARSVASGHLGNVNVAFIPIAALPIIPVIVQELQANLPDVRLALTEMLTVQQVEALRTGQIDIGILRRPDVRMPGEMRLLKSEPYCLAVHRDHPFAQRGDLHLRDLDGQELIMYSPGHGWFGYELLSPIFAQEDIRPKYVQWVGQAITMASMVDSGCGMALVPQGLRRMHFENVVICDIALPAIARSEYYIALSEMRQDDPAVLQVFEGITGAFGV